MNYAESFARLSVAQRSNKTASALTLNKAPHKPFLLLAIFDLIETGQIQNNFIEFNPGLVDCFTRYWDRIMIGERSGNPVLPFYHLKSDKFWHLIPKPGMDQILEYGGKITTYQQLRTVVAGAKFDDELFRIIQSSIGRNELRKVLIESVVSPKLAKGP
jgi:putative restriction endonuclease